MNKKTIAIIGVIVVIFLLFIFVLTIRKTETVKPNEETQGNLISINEIKDPNLVNALEYLKEWSENKYEGSK